MRSHARPCCCACPISRPCRWDGDARSYWVTTELLSVSVFRARRHIIRNCAIKPTISPCESRDTLAITVYFPRVPGSLDAVWMKMPNAAGLMPTGIVVITLWFVVSITDTFLEKAFAT